MLPNALLVGAGKAGTTSLCDELGRHPEIWMYPLKETHYFTTEYKKGLDYYDSLFVPNGEKIVMEGSPDYIEGHNTERSCQRIAKDLGCDLKLIYMVRHPIKRLESAYVQFVANGNNVGTTFEEAVFKHSLLDGSLYKQNLDIVAKYFGREAVHIVFFEDYVAHKRNTLARLCQFLEISEHFEFPQKMTHLNRRSSKVIDTPLMKRLRRLPGSTTVRRLIPIRLKELSKRALLPKVEAEVAWTDDIKKETYQRIIPDAASFLKENNKPVDFWKL